MMKKKVLFSILMTMVLLTGCSQTNKLEKTGWILKSLNGQPALTDSTITLNFSEGKASGTDGCNSINGSYKSGGNKLTFGKDFMSTMMACSEPVMNQAADYITALNQTKSFNLINDVLTMLDKAGHELAVFKKQNTSDLAGTSWMVTGYNNGKAAVTTLITGSEITLSFALDSKLNGKAGCNNYSAMYEINQGTIKIGPLASTKTMCLEPAGIMEQEAAYLNALSTGSTYRMDGDKLELRNTDGLIALSLKKAQ